MLIVGHLVDLAYLFEMFRVITWASFFLRLFKFKSKFLLLLMEFDKLQMVFFKILIVTVTAVLR